MRRPFLLRTALTALSLSACIGVLPPAHAAETPKHGGSMTISFKDDIATLDPAIGYDWQNWPVIESMFNSLIAFVPGTTKLMPSLAESYTISPDGLTYTFKLRPGVKFSNGRTMTAQDVVYSFNRTCNPKTQSPGASFFSAIQGFDDFQKGKADHLSGVTAPDDSTAVIKLSQPYAPFPYVLAVNFAFIVPKEEVEKPGADFGKHPVGTGPFMLKEWKLGQHLILVRNPYYWEKGIPYLDSYEIDVGQEPLTALLRLQHGEIDALGDGIPPAKFVEVMHDPKLKPDIVVGPRLETTYITMNTQMKPFDDARVRQAVNYAINKARILKLINGRAAIANQPLPPGIPGYDTSYKGYPYDPKKAKELLKEAGLEGGFSTVLYANNTDPNPRIAQAIQQDLANIGIKADLKTLAQENVIAAGGSPKQAPMVWSGGMAWSDDFPDASDFYTPILSCSSATQGGWNWAWYCRKDLEDQAGKANAMSDPKQVDARLAAWQAIYRKIMADAPWVPVLNEKLYTLKSPRLHGAYPGVLADPQFPPINYPYAWVSDGK
jgi:peptide/nickel transport system substrate-binding protein/oligopeptide transport system substrate-binding protein